MPRSKSSIRIFDYTDYRNFLGDFYKDQKSNNPHFSYRYFAGKAKISSIGLYKDVVAGKQSLSRRVIAKFSEAMGIPAGNPNTLKPWCSSRKRKRLKSENSISSE